MSLNPVEAQDEDFSAPAPEQNSKYVIPDGKYQARCTSLTKQLSKSKNWMLVYEFLGTEGAAEGMEFKHYALYDVNEQTGALEAGWKIQNAMKGFGVERDANGVLPIRKADVVGKNVTLELEAQTFGDKGLQSMSVQAIHPADAAKAAASSGSPLPF